MPGPWVSYTQDLGAWGVDGLLLPRNHRHIAVARFDGYGGVYGHYPGNEQTVRTCCFKHVTQGSAFWVRDWVPWASSCPAIMPGTNSDGSGTLAAYPDLRAGYTVERLGGGGFGYEVTGWQAVLDVQASAAYPLDVTPSQPGLLPWQDPAVAPPPAATYTGDTPDGYTYWEYEPFTGLAGTIEVDVPGSSIVAFAHDTYGVHLRELPAGTDGWLDDGGDTPDLITMEVAVGPAVDDPTVSAAGTLTVNLTTRHTWYLSTTLMKPPTTEPWDPGNPADYGVGYNNVINVRVTTTHQRTGRRRAIYGDAPSVAQPLHQRQRTDGLGGGPRHQSPGLASRQLGGRARGVY